MNDALECQFIIEILQFIIINNNFFVNLMVISPFFYSFMLIWFVCFLIDHLLLFINNKDVLPTSRVYI